MTDAEEAVSLDAASVDTADDVSMDVSEDDNSEDEDNTKNNNDEQDFLDAMEDVHTRFILNLPEAELEKTESLFFQLEQAWWFYEDWICDNAPPDKNLPRFSHLKPFAMKMFEYSFLLPNVNQFKKMWNEFAQFKRKISNFGCILLNESCTKVVLCQVWNGKSHTFPSGKINQGETGIEAAARETYEETGFDPHCQLGMTREMLANPTTQSQVTWTSPLQEQDMLSYQEADGGKRRTCYVCCGVPEDFPFAPVCRKEVSKIAWYSIDKIPRPNYAVAPFISQLRRWIKKRQRGTDNNKKSRSNKKSKKKKTKNKSRERGPKGKQQQQQQQQPNTPRKNSHGSTPGSSRQSSRQREREQGALVESGLAAEGDYSRFTEEDMFKVNEQLLGRKIEYDVSADTSSICFCVNQCKTGFVVLANQLTLLCCSLILFRAIRTFLPNTDLRARILMHFMSSGEPFSTAARGFRPWHLLLPPVNCNPCFGILLQKAMRTTTNSNPFSRTKGLRPGAMSCRGPTKRGQSLPLLLYLRQGRKQPSPRSNTRNNQKPIIRQAFRIPPTAPFLRMRKLPNAVKRPRRGNR